MVDPVIAVLWIMALLLAGAAIFAWKRWKAVPLELRHRKGWKTASHVLAAAAALHAYVAFSAASEIDAGSYARIIVSTMANHAILPQIRIAMADGKITYAEYWRLRLAGRDDLRSVISQVLKDMPAEAPAPGNSI